MIKMKTLAHTRNFLKISVLLLVIYYFINCASAANVTATDYVLLYVNVSEKTMVDIQPSQLSWLGVEPGTQTNVSQAWGWPKEAIQIENIGSTNISRIWFNTSYPSSSPFGTADPSAYDTGNFAVVRRNSSGESFFFVNRVEYNESELIYLQLPAGYAHGRFRSANNEYFWAIDASTGICNASDFRIGKVPHNQTQLGSVDLTTCDAGLTTTGGGNPCRSGTLTATTSPPYAGGEWGYANLYIGPDSNYENYTVAVYWNCSSYVRAMFYHWNMDAPGAQELGQDGHHMYFSTATLTPGANIIANVKLRIPYGTVAGNISGTMTVQVQAINVGG